MRGQVYIKPYDTPNGIEKLRTAINEADAVIIGAGAGISTSAGLTYSGERFDKYFFDFAKRMFSWICLSKCNVYHSCINHDSCNNSVAVAQRPPNYLPGEMAHRKNDAIQCSIVFATSILR